MTPNAFNPEQASSLEYLARYGQFVTDISLLLSALENQSVSPSSETTFHFFVDQKEFTPPQSITAAIGEVRSADITFSDDSEKTLVLELFGETGSYLTTRYQNSQQKPVDTILHFCPLNTIEQFTLNDAERRQLPQHSAPDDDFVKTYENIPGIDNNILAFMLMQLAHPNIVATLKDRGATLPADVNIFHPDIYTSLVDSSRVTSISQHGLLSYHFLADDSTHLTYHFEAGAPTSFQLHSIDEVTDQPIRIATDFELSDSDSIAPVIPRHAISPGADIAPGWSIDTVYRNAPTLKELTYLHDLVKAELQSLPTIPVEHLYGEKVDVERITVSIDEANIDKRIEEQADQHDKDSETLRNFELDDLFYSTETDDPGKQAPN